MKKKLSDYLHLYLGCEVRVPDEKDSDILVSVSEQGGWISKGCDYPFEQITPILRPLSDMTKNEEIEFETTKVFILVTPVHHVGNMHWTAETFRWALSHSFDLFELIDAGLAIDKTKLPNP